MPWYQRCGIEPPLPLRSVLAWPVLWAYGWIAEKLHRPIVHVPTPLDVLSTEIEIKHYFNGAEIEIREHPTRVRVVSDPEQLWIICPNEDYE